MKYIKDLADTDAAHDLKLAPYLKPKHLYLNHFDKMSVASAVAVLNRSVAAGIRVLLLMGKLPPEASTTAWFLDQVDRWLTFMTSRNVSTGMSLLKESQHEDAVQFLEETSTLFAGLSIKKDAQKDCFKPVQAGLLVSTRSTLELQQKLLHEQKFKFVLLGRLTQDALENLFSCVRSKNPVPRALEFKLTLRLIMLSQFFKPSRKGCYAIDDRVDLMEFLAEQNSKGQSHADPNHSADSIGLHVDLEEAGMPPLEEVEKQSLVYVVGLHFLKCNQKV